MPSRLTSKRFEDLDEEQQAQHRRIARTRSMLGDDNFGGPFDPWIRRPEVAKHAIDLGNYIWNRTVLGRRLVELAILVTARHWRSNVEWWAHEKMARDEGVSEAAIQAAFEQTAAPEAPADEQLTLEVVRSLHETQRLPQALYSKAVEHFGEEGLMDLIQTIGYYTFVSMTLNAFWIPVPEGAEAPFEE